MKQMTSKLTFLVFYQLSTVFFKLNGNKIYFPANWTLQIDLDFQIQSTVLAASISR